MYKIVFIFLSIGILFLSGCSTPEEKADENLKEKIEEMKQSEEEIKNTPSLDVKEFFKDYKANEVAADMKYKDKKFNFSGKVNEVKNDFFGSPYAILSSDGYEIRVDLKKEKAAKLSIGQYIALIGTCDGKSVGESFGIREVIMRDCH